MPTLFKADSWPQNVGAVLADAAFQAACNSQAVPPLEFSVASINAELPLQPLPSDEECSDALREAERSPR